MRTPEPGLIKHLPQDWLVGQQIGLIAHTLSQRDLTMFADKGAFREKLIDQLRRKLTDFRSLGTDPNTLPVSTLYFLAQQDFIDGLDWQNREEFDFWRTRYQEVVTGRWDLADSPRPSQANGAKLVAHQILYSDAGARAICKAATAFLVENFVDLSGNTDAQQTLNAALNVIRDATNKNSDILVSISNITSVFRQSSDAGLLIRNALLDHVLAWPILIYAHDGKPIGAISLPIGVEMSFDWADRVWVESNRLEYRGRKINTEGWMCHLRVAANIGKTLWRAKNGNAGHWRDQVVKSSIKYDFTAADEIISGSLLDVDLSDRSMEAYFAQVVLAKSIGRHAGFSAALTGCIGKQRVLEPHSSRKDLARSAKVDRVEVVDDEMPPIEEERTVLDWEMEWPGDGVDQKQKFVYGSFKFDRFVMPVPPKNHGHLRSTRQPYVETNQCRFLSDAADCVQIGGWRQFKYIRGPDIAHSIHRYPQELPSAESDGVIHCMSLLAGATHAVLKLPAHISSASLFAALRHINFDCRMASDPRPPVISWLVFRAIPEEVDTRFWHLLLRAMGGSRESFDKLRLPRNSDAVATVLRTTFNSFNSGSSTRSERAPDLVVLVGAKHLAASEDDDPDLLAEARPLAFDPVIKALELKLIMPIKNESMRRYVGSTRFIVIESDGVVGATALPKTKLDKRNMEVVERLKIFRFGFTQQMASVCLHKFLGGHYKVRPKLKALCKAGLAAYGNGWYRIRPPASPVTRESPRSDLALATGHFFAGLAFAPYLLKFPVPGLNIAEALLPDHVREAEFHFERAAFFANKVLDDDEAISIRNQARLAQQRCMLFFDIPTLGIVNRLSKKRAVMPAHATYELAREIIEEQEEHHYTPGPYTLTTVARAATQWWRELRKDQNKQAEAAQLFSQIIDMYTLALERASKHERFPRELRLSALTRYSAFLCQHGKSQEQRKLRGDLDQEIVSMLKAEVRGVALYGEWFALYGDDLEDSRAALWVYEIGAKCVPNYFAIFPRWLGAALLSESKKSELRDELAAFDLKRLCEIADWAKNQKPYYIDFRDRQYVIDRFNAGKGFLIANAKSLSDRHARAVAGRRS